MKIKLTLYVFIFLFVITQLLQYTNPTPIEALATVENQFHQGIEEMEQLISEYESAAEALVNDKASVENLQRFHLHTRLTFKKIELFLAYYDNSGITRYINGAPLPKVEPNVAEVVEIKPVGLQVLDELIFSEDVFAEKEEIFSKVKQLKKDFGKIKSYQWKLRMTHRHVFEAVRQELLRVFTLGVTGFDTPGSVAALPEAKESMQAMASAMKAYYPSITEKDAALVEELTRLFEDAIFVLAMAGDFDSFDRLKFLKETINPLYDLVYQAHKTLGVETRDEVDPRKLPVNYDAVNIFSPDFLNTDYYANLDFTNPNTGKRIELGRTLFFDPVLSSNNKRSCASCHNPDKGFTDGLAKSLAMNGEGYIKRNAPTIINAVYAEKYFYDLRESGLERQIAHVVMNEKEFATDFKTIADKLAKSEEYQELFADAYADQPKYYLSKWSVSDALAHYISSLVSFNSPFDQYVRGESDELSESAKRGFTLFMGKAACGTCHFAPTFNGNVPPTYSESESEILGVPIAPDTTNLVMDPDSGRAMNGRPIDEAPFYIHSFKTVTVRNVAKTAPYMHNGAYQTLEQVVDFYNRGGGAGIGMDVPYQTLPDAPLNLTDQEQKDLVAFMESLTDDEIMKDQVPERLPKFGDETMDSRKIGGEY